MVRRQGELYHTSSGIRLPYLSQHCISKAFMRIGFLQGREAQPWPASMEDRAKHKHVKCQWDTCRKRRMGSCTFNMRYCTEEKKKLHALTHIYVLGGYGRKAEGFERPDSRMQTDMSNAFERTDQYSFRWKDSSERRQRKKPIAIFTI